MCLPRAWTARTAWDTYRKYEFNSARQALYLQESLAMPTNMWIWCACKAPNLQESFGIRIENENLKCRQAPDLQESLRIRNGNVNFECSKGLELQDSLGMRSKNANLMCPPSARFARIAWDTQRNCEFDVPAKRQICKNRLGYAAKVRI